MRERSMPVATLPPEQQAIRAKCFHPTETFVEFPIEDVETSIPARFEKIVRLYPDRIAVKIGGEGVTYTQLNAMANRVARRIVSERGAAPEPVGLLMDKGVEQLASMLGALKARKFFVLLDPSFPVERNLAILEDTSPCLILVDGNHTPYGRNLTITSNLIAFESIDPNSVSDDVELEISPNAISNVVYTSGSTGKPKGVVQTHRSKMHLVMLHTEILQLTCNDRCALLSSGTASAIGNSLYALLNGAALHPYSVNKLGISKLADWMVDEEITVCAISAPLFRKFCESLTGAERFPDLRVLRLTSEASYRSDFELYKRFFPQTCCLANVICPSETGTLRQFVMDHDSQVRGDEIPLGYSVDEKEICLLDEDGRELGFNEVGEIVVRSKYLSLGYWNRPELDEETFKVDPQDPTKRIYYTGDLGLMLPDGCLIHKGRKDFRVKIRGYGVETEEVEKFLRSHTAVKDCVVVGRRGESGEIRLVGYYTSEAALPPNVSELRRFLSRSLPEYMVPSMFMKLDEIPLTLNGKVDRRALPEPGGDRPELEIPYLVPRTDVENIVAQIFSDCTGIEQVGIDDNFFELGGDSLILTRLLSRLNVTFQRDFSVQELFERPSVAGISCLLESPVQPMGVSVEPFLSPILRDTPIRLSYPQQRLWFLDQLEPGSCTYNLSYAYRLKGYLNAAALEQSFNEIVRRHEILRTVFKAEDGNPVQIVLPNRVIKIPLLDVRGDSADERWTEVRRLMTQEAQRPFDLAAGPLVRLTLLQLDEDEYVLLRTTHHIVSDGWSEGVLLYELGEMYQAASTGRPSSLADLPLQYANYAKWQRDWLTGERYQSQLTYWKKQLDNVATLNLPTDHPRKAFRARRGRRQYYVWSERLTSELRNFSRGHGATMFMTLVAAFQTLLHRYSNQTDIVIGSPIAGRNREEFEGLIGFFLNMLALRLDLSGNPTFTEVLDRAREMCLGALSHQELPFEKLVEEMHPDRSLAQNPLFQVTFAFQNTPRVSPNLTGLVVEDLKIDTGIGGFDLHLFMEEIEGQLQGYCIYDNRLFNADTIEKMVHHFQTLLEGIVAGPEQRISELPLLSNTERQQLLFEWNDVTRDYAKNKCVHQLFEQQVERTPDAVAVVFEHQQLSYRELNQQANQLAHYLRKFGVGSEALVGICMERSMEMIVGILGILKAGGAYVPLDAGDPAARLNFMLKDAQIAVLLTHHGSFEDAKSRSEDNHCRLSMLDEGIQQIYFDRALEMIARESNANPESAAAGENLAYVMYTSGSTGQPKGVAIEHRNAVAFLSWVHSAFHPEELSGVLAATSICFDLSVFEMFAPLTCGGAVIMAENALALKTLSNASSVSLLNTVPSVMNELLNFGGVPSSLRVINLAGEPLRADLVKHICASTSTSKVHDLYGPTECTTYSTWARRTVDGPQTIGRPIANTQVYILDQQLQPVPIGVVGALHISGAGLARGYLNRPDLTAEKFIPNPFSAEAGARLYKSGDLARYRPDGNIEFLNRMDKQVKIRGFRIELGEIEVILSQHPAVREAIVLAREEVEDPKSEYPKSEILNPKSANANSKSLGRSLVAYVVPRQEEAPSINELRSFLKHKLPGYMVPSSFVFLDALPLTRNGKIDRKALPAPDPNRPEFKPDLVAPRTPIEEISAGIWAEVLKLEKVGVHDNFFDLGGHSLLATQVISRLCDAFGVQLPLRLLFEGPTVEELALAIEEALIEEMESESEPEPLPA